MSDDAAAKIAANRLRASQWKKANRERYNARCRLRAKLTDSDVLAARVAAWRKRNPDKVAAAHAKRRAQKQTAIPLWADMKAVERVYGEAAKLRASGLDCHVDHIVPLQSSLVCGLHWEGNLRIIGGRENISKGNRHWPDMP
jgi:hypothetical protein